MASYTIVINDAQREFLASACRSALDAATPEVKADIDFEYLPDMFDGLPAAEAESPRCLHGFCL